ncbi:MAG: ComEC/Rec2 family competence protein [bacterium]|nr:ComEC/Rec2 family competence protein [bacterium]
MVAAVPQLKTLDAALAAGVGFLCGVGVAPAVTPDPYRYFVLALAAAVLSAWWWRNRTVRTGSLLVIALCVGVLRYQASLPPRGPSFIGNIQGREVAVTGTVVAEPDVRLGNTKLTLGRLRDEQVRPLQGRMLATVRLYPEYHYGDVLRLSGPVKPPESFDDFAYDRYLARSGIFAVSYYPAVELVAHGQGSPAYAALLAAKSRAQRVINRGLPEPSASIFSAMLLGSRQGLPKELVAAFNVTGLTHLVAISGAQIALLISLVAAVLPYFGIHRRRAFYLLTALLVAYLALIGLPASAVRAGVMGWLALFSYHLGRRAQGTRLLLYAAVAMVAVNPMILRDDVGFQLSFAAVAGLLALSPLLERAFSRVPEFFGLRTALAMTVAANIFTLPLIAAQFQRLSVISLLANILVFPVSAVAMVAGLFGLLVAPWAGSLGWALWLPTHAPLAYLTALALWFSRLPFAQVTLSLPPLLLVPSYFALALGVRWLRRWLQEKERYVLPA